jgi:hypothetical protein
VVFGALWAFFEGGAGKTGVFCVVFCGEVVVNCVVNHGSLMVVCAASKIFHFFEIFLWKFAACRLWPGAEWSLTSD